MAVYVTGGSGFIGTRFVRRLRDSLVKEVTILDKQRSATFPELSRLGDVRSLDDLRASMPDGAIVVHLAAEHRDDVRPLSLYDEVNVQGSINICEIAREKGVRVIVFTSSVAVYGFAPIGTTENGPINPFNDYGRTKYEAELIFRRWQEESPESRTLVIIRPTVVFGERNRGNVYNLVKQIASGLFVMVGRGENHKSMAYVENVAAFIQFSMGFSHGVHVFNYVDKPDFTMKLLVDKVRVALGLAPTGWFRMPFSFAYSVGFFIDLIARITNKRFAISAIRVKKFCADSVYGTAVAGSGFIPPVPLMQALERTVRYEFVESHDEEPLFYGE
jgi:nucleoside-diphosphate-sugar epimerase